MKIKPRGNHCVECPYLTKNKKHLNEEQYQNIVDNNAIFPCYMEMKGVIGNASFGVEQYVQKVETFVVCRGRARELGML